MQARTQLTTIAVALLFFSGFAHAETIAFERGDLNGDGQIDFTDGYMAAEYFLGTSTLEVIEPVDFDDDGRITAADVTAIFDVALGLERRHGYERESFRRGDLNDDGDIDAQDLELMGSFFRGAAASVTLDAYDLDADGRIDEDDLVVLAQIAVTSATTSTISRSPIGLPVFVPVAGLLGVLTTR